MALNLLERFAQIFKYTPIDTNTIRDRIPFVHIMGGERTWGAPTKQNFQELIDEYRSWTYACVWKNATSVAQVPLCLYKIGYDAKKKETKEKITEHPFLDVITAVNPFSNRFELMALTQMYLELTGNAYWWIPKNALGIPYMIWVMPSQWVKVVPSAEKFVAGYVLQVPSKGVPIPFDEEDVIHFKFPNPNNLFYGTGPTAGAVFGIGLNKEIKSWGVNFFKNNANPSGVLMAKNGLNEEQFRKLRTQWNEKYRGTSNAGKMAFLEGDLTYQQIGSNIRDSRFEEVSKDIRDEILALYGVPASKLGLVEDVNRANADANDYTYQKETISPRLIMIQEKLNEKLIPLYDVGIKCEFENPVPEDRDFRLREKQANIQMGFSSIDEERELEGLEPYNLPETEVPLISFGLNPAGAPKEDPFAGDFEEEDKEDEKKDDKKKSFTNEKATRKWEEFVTMTEPVEKNYAQILKRFFKEQHLQVKERVNQYRTVKDFSSNILFILADESFKLRQRSLSAIKRSLMIGMTLASRETSPIDFNLFNPSILRTTEERARFVADRINETTWNKLKEILDNAIKNGSSTADISRDIDDLYNFSNNFRARRIAQTEVIGAANQVKMAVYQEAGVEVKEWVTARDEVVRDSHVAMEGQTRKLNDLFTSGINSKLLFPGDRSAGAPAEDTIGCRCTWISVLEA